MKKFLFLVPILFFLNAAAQQQNNNGSWLVPLDKNISQDSLQKIITKLNNQNRSQATLLHRFANGTKMYALPQDNMPCLVPNTSHYNMPVMGKEIKLYGMPPGSQPQPLIPKAD